VELGTFGAILKFALNLENGASAFYDSVVKKIENQTLRAMLEEFYRRKKKRIQLLTRVRRENVTETILEHISGLNGDDYQAVPTIPEELNELQICELSAKMEERIHEFYNVAAIKIGFLYEAADAFERLAEENIENKEKLLALL
jgi:hypothetical protein